MSFRTSTILLLLVSLFVSTQVHPMARPVEMSKGSCAGMQCVQKCCTMTTCCAVTQQQKTPPPQAPASPRLDIQLATIGLRGFSLLYTLPLPQRSYVIRDDAQAGHTLPPLAASCIWLI